MKNNILILHHNDRDGFMSAAVISSYLETGRVFMHSQPDSNIVTKTVNYEQPLKDVLEECLSELKKVDNESDFSRIYLVDYSISNERNANDMIYMNEHYELIWIDHHKSSIEYSKKNPKLETIKGMRLIGISGAGLCWLYYADCSDDITETILEYEGTLNEMPRSIAIDILTKTNVPKFVLYTHRYDIFDLDDSVLKFNYGYNTLNVQSMKKDIEQNSPGYMIYEYINKGAIIKSYIDDQNKKLVKEFGTEIEYHDGNTVYKGLAMNNIVFTSLVYGETIKEYDFVLTYAKKKTCWRCSVYTAKDGVDVSVIAKKFNGGGHEQAAGFYLDKPIWEYKEWKFV